MIISLLKFYKYDRRQKWCKITFCSLSSFIHSWLHARIKLKTYHVPSTVMALMCNEELWKDLAMKDVSLEGKVHVDIPLKWYCLETVPVLNYPCHLQLIKIPWLSSCFTDFPFLPLKISFFFTPFILVWFSCFQFLSLSLPNCLD